MKKSLIDWFWLSGGSVDYSALYAYFDKAVNIAEPGSVFSDTGRTTPATDGDYVKNITEILDGSNLSWISGAARKSYLAQKFASRYNFQAPVYKNPAGDKPHITFPNMLDTQFSSSTFTAGLSAGQTFDISWAIAKIGNGGVGNVVINGGTPIAFNSSSYTEFTETGLTADGSGNIDFTMTITGSGDEAALIGFILTTYP